MISSFTGAFLFLLFVTMLLVTTNLANSQSTNSSYYQNTDNPLGKPYGFWLTKFWDWWNNVPAVDSPKNSPEVKKYMCYLYPQKGIPGENIIFLIDALTIEDNRNYTCSIPVNMSILIPLVESEYDNSSYANYNYQQLYALAKDLDDGGDFELKIDNTKIPEKVINDNRAESGPWDLTYKEGNHFGGGTGTYRAAAEGFFYFLKPLSPGWHTIYYSASSPKQVSSSLPGSTTLGSTSGSAFYKIFVNSSQPSDAVLVK